MMTFTKCIAAEDMIILYEQHMADGDLELRVDGHSLRAHRAVLMARSEVFAAMFTHATAENMNNQVCCCTAHIPACCCCMCCRCE